MKTGVHMKTDKLPELVKTMRALTNNEVLVGFPEDTTARDASAEEPEGITNAALAYIHDRGAPERNIPARPFMIPGIESASGPAADTLLKIARDSLAKASVASVDAGLHRVGLKIQAAMRRKLNEGIPPPLSDRTLRARANRGGKGLGSRKGAKLELELRAAGWAPSVDFAKPLIDTGQLRNAINYVIRPRKARKK